MHQRGPPPSVMSLPMRRSIIWTRLPLLLPQDAYLQTHSQYTVPSGDLSQGE